MRSFKDLPDQLEEHRPAQYIQPTIHDVQRFKRPVIVSNPNVEEPLETRPVIVSNSYVDDYRAAPSGTVFKRGLVEDLPVAEQPGGRGLPELLPTKPASAQITVHPLDNDQFAQRVLREQPLNGFQAGTHVSHRLPREPWTVHNLTLRDRPGLLSGVTGDRSRPTDLILPAARMGNAHARLAAPRLVVTGPNVERLLACSLPGQRRLWAWVKASERSGPLVAYTVNLLQSPTETLSRTPLELLWSLDHGDLGVVGGPLGLSEQVAGLTGTIGKAISLTFASGLEVMGTNPVVALIGGEICGAIGKAIVAPLVAHLVAAAQLIEIFSLILPHGDPRALVSLEAAKGWTEKAVVHGLSDRVEPFADEVATAAAGLLLALLVTGRERSSLHTRPYVEAGSGIKLSGYLRGLDRQPSMATSTSEKRAGRIKRDLYDFDLIDRPGPQETITLVSEPRHRIGQDALTYDRVDPLADRLDTLPTTTAFGASPRLVAQSVFNDGLAGQRDALPKITTSFGASPSLVTQGPRGDGLVDRLYPFPQTPDDDALRTRTKRNSMLNKDIGLHDR